MENIWYLVAIILAMMGGGTVATLIMNNRQHEAESRLRKELANQWARHFRAEDLRAYWLYQEFVKANGSRLEWAELQLYADGLHRSRSNAAKLARLITAACKDWDGRTPSIGDVKIGLRSLWMAAVVWRMASVDTHFDPELVGRLEAALRAKEGEPTG